jgi:hypothetical protein
MNTLNMSLCQNGAKIEGFETFMYQDHNSHVYEEERGDVLLKWDKNPNRAKYVHCPDDPLLALFQKNLIKSLNKPDNLFHPIFNCIFFTGAERNG